MGDFDLSLIREFQSRPSFYDRNCPRFKDKIYTAREWQEIANKLGYDVSLLKDRMLQLRNRYNLEKRRIEQWQQENPGKVIESPWPLYEHLHFLSKHIRARRSYKRMLQNQPATEDYRSNSNSAGSYLSPTAFGAAGPICSVGGGAPYINGLLDVKMEEEQAQDSGGGDSDTHSSGDDSEKFLPANATMMVETNLIEDSSPLGCNDAGMQPHHQQQQQQQQQQHNGTSSAILESVSLTPTPAPVLGSAPAVSTAAAAAAAASGGASVIGVVRLETLQNQNSSMGLGLRSSQRVHYHHNQHHQHQQQQHYHHSMPLSAPHLVGHHMQDLHQHRGAMMGGEVRSRMHSSSTTTTTATTTPGANAMADGGPGGVGCFLKGAQAPFLPQKAASYSSRELKYAAFGNFITASLLELPQKKALMIVERFTSDLVNVLMQKYEVSSMASPAATVVAGGSGAGDAATSSVAEAAAAT